MAVKISIHLLYGAAAFILLGCDHPRQPEQLPEQPEESLQVGASLNQKLVLVQADMPQQTLVAVLNSEADFQFT
ncbi:hypothetical protein K0504_02250 [Neiella marina]|uniref:Uncharacterized protein n=1 Tax=Neiella holothuriorum TaxID=2870530 RepID=A0ABS7EBY5_9GAMM|nr:hypothetical protein [Neiella holothuriorum]MBW8189843.1 hypothetical protein [Neiella holothuriorum]